VRDLEAGETVAAAVRAAARLRLVGVGGFEGALARDRSAADLSVIRGYVGSLRELVDRLDRAHLFAEADEIIATAGGSAYFDDVATGLKAIDGTSRPVRVVLRSGAYVTHDDGHYTHLTPLGGPEALHAALRLRGRVLSRPEPGLALLDFGKRDAPMDLGLPVPLSVTRATGGATTPLAGAAVTALADQHAFVSLRADTWLAIGDIVTCGISHPCTAFDKWQLIPVVADGHVVDLVRTFF
jgi:D-serine deaminase-like pyridoxal phosphate-dependent protein